MNLNELMAAQAKSGEMIKGNFMFKSYKKADAQLKEDVESELRWDPSVVSEHVRVTAKEGVITLWGSVPHYYEKITAEKAAQRVGGVRAVADELEVKLIDAYERGDEDIAQAALSALDWSYSAPSNIKVTVEKGWITLRGEAEWDYQRNSAKDAVSNLMGVRGVSNNITLQSKVQTSDVKAKIEEALKRSAESEGRKIHVTVSGSRVNLTGNVHSFSEIEDARLAAWSAPGVMSVDTDLKIAA